MRYCRFQHSSGAHFGRIENVDGVDSITELLNFPESNLPLGQPQFEPIPLSSAKLMAPVKPSKIVCVGRNYRDHASELGNEVPKEPLLFLKPPSTVTAPEESIVMPPASVTQRVDYEGEIAAIVGRRASKLKDNEPVLPYLRGFTCVNDVTARDLQKTDGQWTRAKGFDTFCPVGPMVVSAEEFDVASAEVLTRLNGEERQHGHAKDFIFSLDVVVRYISHIMTLEPGDLISTGTPAGVAPMKSGDVVEVEIPGIGVLRNKVATSQ